MPVRQDESTTNTKTAGKQAEIGSSNRRRRTARKQNSKQQQQQNGRPYENDTSATTWLGRLWSGIRRLRDSSSPVPAQMPAKAVVESGTAAVGDVRNPCVAIPADIMFSPQRAALYSTMASLLVRNPYYISRIVYQVKYHECDALLGIILNSLFGDVAHEPSLIALFKEIIEAEVDRTVSIETLMRNDAPSLQILSTYLKNQACLEYLQVAVKPTVEVIVELGNVSLDPELATVYQDWARSQRTMRLPPVVSAVEAASYTEVQNLSRRRHRHLLHVATHCLFDIVTTRHRIPAGLAAICTSTLQATRRKFPDVDAVKGYSLVGGMFFLRFINAALTTPHQYGLLDAAPLGTVNSNLKLVARLMQRLSNNSGKMPEEWPPDARKFMRANIEKFHLFLESLTGGTDVPQDPATAALEDDSAALGSRRVQSACTLPVNNSGNNNSSGVGADEGKRQQGESTAEKSSSPEMSVIMSHRVMTMPWSDRQPRKGRSRRLHHIISLSRSCASEQRQPVPSHLGSAGMSAAAAATTTESSPAAALQAAGKVQSKLSISNGEMAEKDADLKYEDCSSSSSNSPGSKDSSPSSNGSARSMFDMGQTMMDGAQGGRRPSRSGAFGDVILPLNDLYLLQKYLLMYEDAWVAGEAGACCFSDTMKSTQTSHKTSACLDGKKPSATPMQDCLRDLGPAPALVRTLNNHRTRIPLV